MSKELPLKFQTKAKTYQPVGFPKVKMPKLPSTKLKGTPKAPVIQSVGNLRKFI